MAEGKKDSKKESSSSSEKKDKKSNDSSCLKMGSWGCGCLILILLMISFILGTMFGRKVIPRFFEKTHETIDAVSNAAHEGVDKADEEITKERE